MKKKVLSMALAFVMIFGTALTSFAAEYDLIHKTGNPKYSFTEFAKDSAITKEVGEKLADYVMEYKGKYYSTQDLQDFMLKNPGKMIKDAVKSGVPEQQKPGKPGPGTNLHIMSISAITSTQVEVTLRDSVTEVAPADFTINNGVSVMDAKIKPETENKTVVLTTTAHEEKNYELTYKNSAPFLYIGKINLGAVLLEVKDNKAEIKINPGLHELTPAEITATLVGFPEGTEAVIAFSSSFGDIVSQKTTENQKVTVQLKPQTTLIEQTAIVKGQVIDVKNPKTGKSYPEYKNSTVNTLNIRFKVVQESDSEKTYTVKIAYADQADRVYIPLLGGLEDEFDKVLKYQPEVLAEATDDLGVKALVRSMHDIMFSKIEKEVDEFVAKKDFSAESIEKLKATMGDLYKKTTADEMRKYLIADIGAARGIEGRFSFYSAATKQNKKELVEDVQTLYNNGTLEGMLSYYRALSKFIVEDNVKDVQAPVDPDAVYPVEHLYKEKKAGEVSRLVLVLPANRAAQPYEYKEGYTQIWEFDATKKNYGAKSLTDNASHRLLFVNSDSQSTFRISGDPTFALADREELRIISATIDSYKGKSGGPTITPPETGKTLYCPIPYGVDVEKTGHIENPLPPKPGEETYEGQSFDAIYTISPEFKKKGVKYAELKVVFSESVYNEFIDAVNNKSIYHLDNWTIDGVNLGKYFKDNMDLVNIRVVSTDPTRHLRDAAVISLMTVNPAVKDPVKDFVESSNRKKVEINSVGDWAYRTDLNNIIKTDSYEYSGKEAPKAPPVTIENPPAVDVVKEFASGNPFVVRAIANKEAADYDYIYVLFSEPMSLVGNNSPLLKQVYTVDSTKGEDLVSGQLNITKGIEGTAFENSPCAFTLRLKKGTLITSDENTLTIKNAMSQVDTDQSVDVSIQLPYARELVLAGETVEINDKVLLNDAYAYGQAIDAKNNNTWTNIKTGEVVSVYPITKVKADKVEMMVYEDKDGNTINIKDWVAALVKKYPDFNHALADFLTLHPTVKELTPEEQLQEDVNEAIRLINALLAPEEITAGNAKAELAKYNKANEKYMALVNKLGEAEAQAKVANYAKLKNVKLAIDAALASSGELQILNLKAEKVLVDYSVSGTVTGLDDPTKYQVKILTDAGDTVYATIDLGADGKFDEMIVIDPIADMFAQKFVVQVVKKETNEVKLQEAVVKPTK